MERVDNIYVFFASVPLMKIIDFHYQYTMRCSYGWCRNSEHVLVKEIQVSRNEFRETVGVIDLHFAH